MLKPAFLTLWSPTSVDPFGIQPSTSSIPPHSPCHPDQGPGSPCPICRRRCTILDAAQNKLWGSGRCHNKKRRGRKRGHGKERRGGRGAGGQQPKKKKKARYAKQKMMTKTDRERRIEKELQVTSTTLNFVDPLEQKSHFPPTLSHVWRNRKS